MKKGLTAVILLPYCISFFRFDKQKIQKDLLSGFMRYLNMVGHMDFSSNPFWYCTGGTTVNWISNMCSTLFILNMTFDRLYSIIRPHKAAAFNTVKKTKITMLHYF